MKSGETVTVPQIHENYSKLINSCDKLNSYTRSIRLQKNKITECEHNISYIKGFRHQAQSHSDEAQANQFFHMMCMLNAMRSALLLWVHIKEGTYDKAWTDLIDAQEYTAIALKVSDYEEVRNLEENLQFIEKSIFPGFALYSSPGWTETVGDCSICGSKFSECDHIENQIYMGNLCRRINRKLIELDHAALVKDPRDRRCILTEISNNEGEMINNFTLEKTGEKKELGSDGGMRITSIICSFAELDL